MRFAVGRVGAELPLRRSWFACVTLALALVGIAALAACQEKSNSPTVTIHILGDKGASSYRPGNLVVNLGTIVTWINEDTQPHSVTAPGAFDSGMIGPNGGRWSWLAAFPGTFNYSSIGSPSMTGMITVVVPPPGAPPPTTPPPTNNP